MTKKKTPTDSATTPVRAKRTRKPAYYLATVYGTSDPVVVAAPNHKAAVALLVTLTDASAADLIEAGKLGYRVVEAAATGAAAPVAAAVPVFPALSDPA